ncbi:MAG TPA: 5-formyltetrahydrofolate cyclo-ligase [Oligoflexia bacterium]|nr:5-formyltetrahydrofolate cyclo-ligase [Oligoflexia bacterium]HMP49792.1 5-formyltetrahydrofolate cyclo-ligase [Oligoflexia bacterium]
MPESKSLELLDKSAFRKRLLEMREAISDREKLSRTISEYVINSSFWMSAKRICAYVSIGSEVPTSIILETALSDGKELFLPWVNSSSSLSFTRVSSLMDLERGVFGILEPKKSLRIEPEKTESGFLSQVFPFSENDLILVPGVGFDMHGNRIGYGKGHYDRFLVSLSASVLKVGLSFSEQIVPAIPAEPHDIPLDLIVTEDGIIQVVPAG